MSATSASRWGRAATRWRILGLDRALNGIRRFLPILALGTILVLVSVTRLIDLGEPQLNRDEAASWYLSSRPLPALLAQSSHETFPPLYLLLLKAWMLLFGDSEASVRSLSIAPWLGTVLVTYVFSRSRLGRWPALLAAVMVALSPAILENSISARMYTLEMFFATSAWFFAWRLIATEPSGPALAARPLSSLLR